MPSVTAVPFALTFGAPAPSAVTAGANLGSGQLRWRLSMLEGAVAGADSAFYGTAADDVTYGTPIPPGDPGGDVVTEP